MNLKESQPIESVEGNEIEVEKSLFRWLITNDPGSAIFITKDFTNVSVTSSNFVGCITTHTEKSGSILFVSKSGTFLISKSVFLSCYGGYSSCIYISETSINEINRTQVSGCQEYFGAIYLLSISYITSDDINATFCLSLRHHVFCADITLTSYCSHFILYKNPTTINFAVTSNSNNNYFQYGAFIENGCQLYDYGIVHSNRYNEQVTYVNNAIFMGNSLPLFNPTMGTMYTNNITCDHWSISGNQQVYQSNVTTDLSTIFASPELYLKYDRIKYCGKSNNVFQVHNIIPYFCIYLLCGNE